MIVVERPLENITLLERRHHCDEGLQKSGLCSAPTILNSDGSLSCHICCDMGPRFLRSRPRDRPKLVTFFDKQGVL